MKEIIANIWDCYDMGYWIVIPTNGTIKKNGEAVMGRGLALQLKYKMPNLPLLLGDRIKNGNDCQMFDGKIITFPVKHNWWEKADLKLIEQSAIDLYFKVLDRDYCNCCEKIDKMFLPRVGCGNGKLDWKDVKPILEKQLLGDRFIVVSI